MTNPDVAKTPLSQRAYVIVLVAGLLRLATLLPALGAAPISDEIEYHGLATRLADGQGYCTEEGRATAYRPPLWPAALSLVYRVTGPSSAAARVTQTLLGTLLVGLILVLAQVAAPITPRARAALGWWAALSPTLLYYSHSLFSETLFALCLLAGLAALLTGRVGWAGLALGLACLCRGSALVMLALFVGWAGLRRGRRAAMLLAAAAALTIAPWTLRNRVVLGDWVIVDTNGALNLYWGNHERTPLLRAWDLVDEDDKPWPLAAGSGERQVERAAMGAAVAHITGHPGRFLLGLVTKTSALWGPERGLPSGIKGGLYGQRGGRVALLAAGLCALESWLLLTLGGVGLAVGWARRLDLCQLTALAIGALTLIHAISYGHSRYRFGVAPLLMVAACSAWPAGLGARGRRWAWGWAGLVALNLAAQVALELAR